MLFATTTEIFLSNIYGFFSSTYWDRNEYFKRVAFETDFFLTHREIFLEFRWNKPKSDCIYQFMIDWEIGNYNTNLLLINKIQKDFSMCTSR